MRRLVYLWPVPALATVLVADGFGPVAWMVVLLTLLSLWPAAVAAGMVFGPRVGIGASVAATALLLGWALLPRPDPVEQSALLDKRFWLPDHAMRHTIRPPVDSVAWSEQWAKAPAPIASLWFFVSADPQLSRRLIVTLNGAVFGALGRETALPGATSDQFGRMDWHRLQVTRTALEAHPLLEIVVRPDPTAPPPAGEIGLLGGFAFRSTAGPRPSAFYDGNTWSDATGELFDLLLPRSQLHRPSRLEDPYRYYIELRLTQPETGRVLATYY